MFHIQTLNKISPVGLNKFDPANYTVDAPETTPDAIMAVSYTHLTLPTTSRV